LPNIDLDYDTSRLVHRFFISDTISGIESQGGFKSGDKPTTVIRYAKSVKLRVQLDPNKPESIRRPLLYITFEERIANTIVQQSTT